MWKIGLFRDLSRFPATSLMSAATVLVKAAWPEDPLQLFGEAEGACLCKGAQAAVIVLTSQCTSRAKQ